MTLLELEQAGVEAVEKTVAEIDCLSMSLVQRRRLVSFALSAKRNADAICASVRAAGTTTPGQMQALTNMIMGLRRAAGRHNLRKGTQNGRQSRET